MTVFQVLVTHDQRNVILEGFFLLLLLILLTCDAYFKSFCQLKIPPSIPSPTLTYITQVLQLNQACSKMEICGYEARKTRLMAVWWVWWSQAILVALDLHKCVVNDSITLTKPLYPRYIILSVRSWQSMGNHCLWSNKTWDSVLGKYFSQRFTSNQLYWTYLRFSKIIRLNSVKCEWVIVLRIDNWIFIILRN